MRARGLKLVNAEREEYIDRSRPMRARGLKLATSIRHETTAQSRPMRARGLKRLDVGEATVVAPVAPHAGAWIETQMSPSFSVLIFMSRPMRARGLKQQQRY